MNDHSSKRNETWKMRQQKNDSACILRITKEVNDDENTLHMSNIPILLTGKDLPKFRSISLKGWPAVYRNILRQIYTSGQRSEATWRLVPYWITGWKHRVCSSCLFKEVKGILCTTSEKFCTPILAPCVNFSPWQQKRTGHVRSSLSNPYYLHLFSSAILPV